MDLEDEIVEGPQPPSPNEPQPASTALPRPEYTDEDRRREAMYILSTIYNGSGCTMDMMLNQADQLVKYIETGEHGK